MPAIARSLLPLRGPCTVTYDSATFYAREGVDIGLAKTPFGVAVSGVEVDSRLEDLDYTVSFTPSGRAAGLAVLYAMLGLSPGAPLFGDTDKPLVVTNAQGTYTFAAAAITRPPDLILSNNKTMFGPVTFTCLQASNTAFGTARLAITAGSSPAMPTASDIITAPVTLSGGFGAIETQDGVTVSVEPVLADDPSDSHGRIQIYCTDVRMRARFVPKNLTGAGFGTALALTLGRGATLRTATDLVATNGTVTATLKHAQLLRGQCSPQIAAHHWGESEWVAVRPAAFGAIGSVAAA